MVGPENDGIDGSDEEEYLFSGELDGFVVR